MVRRRWLRLVMIPVLWLCGENLAAAFVTPYDLAATTTSSNTIALRWTDPDTGLDGFRIERSLNARRYFVPIAIVGDVRSFVDTNLAAGTTYYYRVRALYGGSMSRRTRIASATTWSAPVFTATPIATRTATATPAATRTPLPTVTATVTRTATAVPTATRTTTPLPTVTVTRTTTPLPTVTLTATPLPTVTRTATPLPTATVTRTSTPLPTATVTRTSTPVPTSTPSPAPTGDTVPPAPPGGVTAAPSGCTSMSLTWNPATDAGGSGLKGYNVYRSGVFMKQVLAPTTGTTDVPVSPTTVYAYALSAVDNAGNVSGMSNTANANTPACNQAPVANAGADLAGTIAAPLTLNGAGSFDPDGTIASYAWSFGDGGVGSGAVVSHAFAAAGSHTVTLTVTDAAGAQDSDTATVTITNGVAPWARRFGSAGTETGDAVAIDHSTGDVVFTGTFSGSVDFGGGALISAGGADIYLARYSATGVYRWARRVGSVSTDYFPRVAVAPNGDVVLSTFSSGTVDLGGGPLASAGSYDIFLATYDGTTGAHRWSMRVGGTDADYARAVTVDAAGAILLTGSFKGSVDFGTGLLTSDGYGGSDLFVAKYDADGATLWARNFSNAGPDEGNAIAVDTSGNVGVTGYFNGNIDFGTGRFFSLAATSDTFVLKLSATGATVWVRVFGEGGNDDVGRSIAFDATGDVVMAGTFWNTIDVGGGPLTAVNLRDIVVAKFAAANGAHRWSHSFGGLGHDSGRLAVGSDGSVFLAATFDGTANFGAALTSAGGTDIAVAKYTTTGALVWARRFGATGDDAPSGIDVDSDGAAIVSGAFQATVDFGSGALTSAGGSDVFVARLAP